MIVTLILITSCGGDLSGNASETGNPIIMGEALLKSGQAVDSVTLIVRKQNSTSDDENYSYLGEEFDENGEATVAIDEFDFTLLESGTYLVELRSGDTLSAIQYLTVLADRTYELPQMVLDTLESISGSVTLHGGSTADVYVYAKGQKRFTKVESDGTFTLPVPQGLVAIKVVPQSEEYLPVEMSNILTGTTLDEIKILAKQPVSTNYECDSLIIRTILDSNRLYSIKVEQVTEQSGGRVVEFDVAPDTNQPDLINISGQIVTIPSEIGGLTALEELEIQYTSLTSLPESIGLLTNLIELELNDNNLTSLPQSIVNLTPTGELTLSRNALKLSAQQAEWATKYDPDWEESQQ